MYIHIHLYTGIFPLGEWGRVPHPTIQKFVNPPHLEKFPPSRLSSPPTSPDQIFIPPPLSYFCFNFMLFGHTDHVNFH